MSFCMLTARQTNVISDILSKNGHLQIGLVMQNQFNQNSFLRAKFGDADGVIGMLSAFGVDAPPKDTVRKWFERGGIPSAWLPMLLVILELEDGSPVRLAQFINDGGRNNVA